MRRPLVFNLIIVPLAIYIILVSTMAVVSCGANRTRHTLVVTDAAIAEVLKDIHAIEQGGLCGLPTCANTDKVEFIPGWTLARSQAFNKQFLPAVEAGSEFNQTIKAWDPATPMPAKLTGLIESLAASLTRITADFPPGSTREAILGNIARGQALILNTIAAWLALKG